MSLSKQNVLSIFGIVGLTEADFFDKEKREESEEVQALREDNGFLFAPEEPGVSRIERYYRGDCIPRVSFHVKLTIDLHVLNFNQGIAGGVAW